MIRKESGVVPALVFTSYFLQLLLKKPLMEGRYPGNCRNSLEMWKKWKFSLVWSFTTSPGRFLRNKYVTFQTTSSVIHKHFYIILDPQLRPQRWLPCMSGWQIKAYCMASLYHLEQILSISAVPDHDCVSLLKTFYALSSSARVLFGTARHQREEGLHSVNELAWHMGRFLSSLSSKPAPITSMEPASCLAGLTDDFDLSRHEDLLLVDTYGCRRRERLTGWSAGVEDERLILRSHPGQYQHQASLDR